MENDVDYEQVGRFIYGFVRVRSCFDSFCQALEPGAAPISPDTPVRHHADRAQVMLAQRYGAESTVVREFGALTELMLAGDARMGQIKAGFDAANVPSDAETGDLLSVPARLDRIRQLMSAA